MDPWDGMSEKELTEDERKQVRYNLYLWDQNGATLLKIAAIFKNLWLLGLGAGLVVTGLAGKIFDFFKNGGELP